MKFPVKLAVASVAMASVSAFAATSSTFDGAHQAVESAVGVYISTPVIDDDFWFMLSGPSFLSSNTTSSGITGGSYGLFDGGSNLIASWSLDSGVNTLTLGSGTYYYEVLGAAPGLGFYSLGSTVTAVPEPETYAMMIAGLAALGFLARRRT